MAQSSEKKSAPPLGASEAADSVNEAAGHDAGLVVLVGAGPGDPELITVAGRNWLGRADVVVYDALASARLLDYAPAGAQLIDAGKRAADHRLTQDQTQQVMRDHARAGKLVVRLKGGDPYLFGRGAEEVAYLASHGIRCHVVPGICAGIAAPAFAGIPVTHRKIASTVTFVTGHEDPTKPRASVDYASLVPLVQRGGTVCLYMATQRLPMIAQQMIDAGLDPATSAAAVQWGSTPRQKHVRSTLAAIVDDMAKREIAAPAIVVLGPVAGIEEPGLDFFTTRALFGKTIAITRTRAQASALRQQLESLGACVIEAPTIRIMPAPDARQLTRAADDLAQGAYHWLVLTSPNGVQALADTLEQANLDARALGRCRIAVIGPGTAHALAERLSIRPDLIPEKFVAEQLAASLLEQPDISGQTVCLWRAQQARDVLPQTLSDAGVKVDIIDAYRTEPEAALPQALVDALDQHRLDWITFTSSSTAEHFAAMLPDAAQRLASVKRASIGPITSSTLGKLGIAPTIEADESTIAGLVRAIVRAT